MRALLACAMAASLPVLAAQADSADAAERNHLMRVVTVSQDGLTAEAGKPLLDATLSILDRAAAFRPDIVCLPETFTRDKPESVPGPTTDRLGRWAREHSCYVICPISTRVGEHVFNSAMLLDRQGKVVGRYDKIRPTEGELERGVCPGTPDPPIFETDFGPIGVQICFDVNWREQWRRLKEQGARIIFFPSAYPAARQLRSHAWLQQCFVVSATQTRAASIYDITGDVLETTGKYRRWAGAVLPVGKRLFEIDFHVGKMRRIEQKYGDKVQITWHHDDDLVTLASLDPELTVDDLIVEFELTPHTDYIQRAQQAQDERRSAFNDEFSRKP
ncbi:MAG: carbon-nitrogen hydrolase family protein [Pirellulaceae bacterium]